MPVDMSRASVARFGYRSINGSIKYACKEWLEWNFCIDCDLGPLFLDFDNLNRLLISLGCVCVSHSGLVDCWHYHYVIATYFVSGCNDRKVAFSHPYSSFIFVLLMRLSNNVLSCSIFVFICQLKILWEEGGVILL